MSRCSVLIQDGSLAKEAQDVSKLKRNSGGKVEWMKGQANAEEVTTCVMEGQAKSRLHGSEIEGEE